DDRGGDKADHQQSVDLVRARGVRRQSAAILFRRGGAAGPGLRRLPILAALMRRPRQSSALRFAVRAGAATAIGASLAVPLLRRRLRIPAPVTIAVAYSGPLALAVLTPRSKKRDVAMFTLQMLAFTFVHEIPYDDPERLRRRLRSQYPIAIDRVIGA